MSHLITSSSTAETATAAFKGTLRWQARELLDQDASADDVEFPHHTKESDIWAFAMTCLVCDLFSIVSRKH